ncbi:MAG: glycosyltransferase family 2 protein [Patescibacteria group bacterium]
MVKLSITIVNYNQKYFPKLCVEALKKSKTDFEFEIIICDNNSHDDSLDYLKKAHEEGLIKLVEPGRNLGYGAGHNFAAREAKGKYLLILNTDITVEPDTLQKLVDYMEEHKDVGMVGPKLMYHDGRIQQSCRRHFKIFDLFIKRSFLKKMWPFKQRYRRYIMGDFNHSSTQVVDLITGAFMVMPRELFEKINGFDERYFMFMEDFDLCRKTQDAGYKVVYYPEAVAVHYHKRLSDGSWFKLPFKKVFWFHFHSAIKYHWKWRSR